MQRRKPLISAVEIGHRRATVVRLALERGINWRFCRDLSDSQSVEIDNLTGDETEPVSNIDHVRRRDVQRLVDTRAGLLNTTTVLIANQATETG